MRKSIVLIALSLCIWGCFDTKSRENKEETKDMENGQKVNVFQKIKPEEITDNTIKLIGKDWMLVTAGTKEKFNTMTASWGCIGHLWNKPVAVIFIRPQRYTFGFTEEQDSFTLSFFGDGHREALTICGTLSGRDVNKVEKAGLTPYYTENGNVAFEEAVLVLECKKLYADFLNKEAFLETGIVQKDYPEGDFHKMYIAEIVNVWEKK